MGNSVHWGTVKNSNQEMEFTRNNNKEKLAKDLYTNGGNMGKMLMQDMCTDILRVIDT